MTGDRVEEVAGVRTVVREPDAPAAEEWILYVHGGGFTAGRPEDFDAHLRWLAEQTGARVFAPAYRLAPAHRYPAAVDDCVAVHRALAERHREDGSDGVALAVVGVSAGGTIATTAVTRLGPGATRVLVLESPLLDDALTSASSRSATDPVWGREAAGRAWAAYLPPDAPEGARPARTTANLPPVHVSVGAGELSLDETRDWVERIARAGGTCSLRVWDGQFHGFETKRPDDPVSRSSRAAQLAAIRAASASSS